MAAWGSGLGRKTKGRAPGVAPRRGREREPHDVDRHPSDAVLQAHGIAPKRGRDSDRSPMAPRLGTPISVRSTTARPEGIAGLLSAPQDRLHRELPGMITRRVVD